MTTRERLIAEALTYVDTPYVDGGRAPGAGLDCVGVAWCAARAVGLGVPLLPYYGRAVDVSVLRSMLRGHMVPIRYGERLPGDVLTFRYITEQHFGLLVTRESFVHVSQKSKVCRVEGLRPPWVDARGGGRLCGAWRFREFAA